jgi:hypothetical protein
MGHDVEIRYVFGYFTLPWFARCTCGWQGDTRLSRGEAVTDGDQHTTT